MTPSIIKGKNRSTASSDPGEEGFQIHKSLIKEEHFTRVVTK